VDDRVRSAVRHFLSLCVMREYWRSEDGQWRGGLLMDLLAPELDSSR
jgi:hypothetical protein